MALEDIGAGAKDGSNLMVKILDGVKKGATLGEVIDVLKVDFGTWTEPPIYW